MQTSPPLRPQGNGISYVDIENVVRDRLCHRCGGCVGICPSDAIGFLKDMYPRINREKCTACGLCATVCSGHEFRFSDHLPSFGGSCFDTEKPLGAIRRVFAGHSTDSSIRRVASSGGVVTGIVSSLLDDSTIKGVVAVGTRPEDPIDVIGVLARDSAEAKRSTQSKYVVTPTLHLLGKAVNGLDAVAVVGLPCQMHTLRKWMAIDARLEGKIRLTIGLFCHMNLERTVIPKLLKAKGVPVNMVEGIEFRGGEWPGKIRTKIKGGGIRPLHCHDIKDGAFNYLNRLYVSERCLLCLDFGCETADIAVSDPWIRGKQGDYLYPGGWSLVYARTQRGLDVLMKEHEKGTLHLVDVDVDTCQKAFRTPAMFKKNGGRLRIRRLAERGSPFPRYDAEYPRLSRSSSLRCRLMELTYPAVIRKGRAQTILTRIFMSPLGGGVAWMKSAIKKILWRRRS